MAYLHPIEFKSVIEKLHLWRQEALHELKVPETHEAALNLKRQLDAAIACLELCERHQIRPQAQVLVLPKVEHGHSEYRIMEDSESDNRNEWTE